MIIASIVISPLDKGIHVGDYVRKAIAVIERSGLNYRVCSMSTEVEAPDLDTIFNLVREMDEALLDAGSQRISILIKIDQRTDMDATMEHKIERVKGV